MSAAERNQLPKIDSETLARVTREVLARLDRPTAASSESLSTKTRRTAASVADRVISSATISRLPVETGELFVSARAVVTPSARDDARERGIAINRGEDHRNEKSKGSDHRHGATPPLVHAAALSDEIVDFEDPARAEAVRHQLSRRAIASVGAQIILSDTPARELYVQYTRHDQITVMAGSLEEVERFSRELAATVWVLDMMRLNLTAAVNAAVLISRKKGSQR